jgi:hypothetical protein
LERTEKNLKAKSSRKKKKRERERESSRVSQTPVAHTWNPSYPGGRDMRIVV